MSEISTHATTIGDRLLQLFLFLGSEWILYVLLFLSVMSVAIAIERLLFFHHHHDDLEALQHNLRKHLTDCDIDGAKSTLRASPSPVAQISLLGLEALPHGAPTVEEELAGATQFARLKMERGLAFLGTLGNNAPFIGLFGTVLGIIRSFRDLSQNTLEGSSAVMGGIAEALIATAVGLLVALPAVAVFNAFKLAIRKRLSYSNAMGRTILAHAKSTQT